MAQFEIKEGILKTALLDYRDEAISIACENLLRDIAAVFGGKVKASCEHGCKEDAQIVVATQAMADAVPQLKKILAEDKRGTIFGIYDFCQMLGVSPWYFWGDVPVKKRESFALAEGIVKADWPSVKYRGIFLNDEEELESWAKLHTNDDTIGPEAYEKIYELILRLKGNYIWPAMHVNYFAQNPENGRQKKDIVILNTIILFREQTEKDFTNTGMKVQKKIKTMTSAIQ